MDTGTVIKAIAGTNVNGGIVGWLSPEEAMDRYEETPTWELAINHPTANGHSFHIGAGIFLHRCATPGCGAYVLSFGSVPRYAYEIGIGNHEVSEHGTQVPGINVGLLS